jgi:hypothetical protein
MLMTSRIRDAHLDFTPGEIQKQSFEYMGRREGARLRKHFVGCHFRAAHVMSSPEELICFSHTLLHDPTEKNQTTRLSEFR